MNTLFPFNEREAALADMRWSAQKSVRLAQEASKDVFTQFQFTVISVVCIDSDANHGTGACGSSADIIGMWIAMQHRSHPVFAVVIRCFFGCTSQVN